MRPHRRSFVVVSLALFAAFAGCQESSLSDVEIDDPALLKPEIKIKKSVNVRGNAIYAYEAFIYDKNDDLVELKNGEATIEGEPMTVARMLGDLPYYRLDPPGKLPFLFDTTYTITITLPNGERYPSTAMTQPMDMTAFVVPAEHDGDSAMTVTWSPADPEAVMTLEALYRSAEGSGIETYQINQPGSGRFTVPATLFAMESGVTEVEFTLYNEYFGEINPAFMSGASVVSRISIEAECSIK
jgi:hypothetical protein